MRFRKLGSFFLAFALGYTTTSAFAVPRTEPPDSAAVSTRVNVRAVGAILTTVSDMDRSIDFYSRVLTFEKVSDSEFAGEEVEDFFGVFGARVRIVRMALADEAIDLVQFLTPKGRPVPVDSHSNDVWFQHIAIIVSDMDRAYQILRDNKVEYASSSPQRLPAWNKNAAGITAFYFKDPDGHPLELLQFPKGRGDAKWHRASTRLFLGIDHTAIVVVDTDTSLHFYRDLLGLHVAGESENYGSEQEHLNNVFGAHLRITALRAPAGPGIELLEYLSPRDGRAYPSDERANDLVHRQTELEIESVEAAVALLRAAKARFVSFASSSADEHLQNSLATFSQAIILRDPDGHALGLMREAPERAN